MIWLALIVAGVIAVLLLFGGAQRPEPDPPSDEARYRAEVRLHRIRTRMDTALLNCEMRLAAAAARRELRDELEAERRDRW